MTKTVHLSYYALIKDERGVDQETRRTDAKTVSDLYQQLRLEFSLSLNKSSLNVSINDTMVPWGAVINDDDHIVFIPPVSGGAGYTVDLNG